MIDNLETQIVEYCRFCAPPEIDRILFSSKNFYIMLSLGPISEGYLLLVSKSHLNCCASFDISINAEFDYLHNEIKRVLKIVYGNCIVFEHGRAGSCLQLLDGSKHCYHAHMHYIPVNVPLNEIVSRDFDEVTFNNLKEFREWYTQNPSAYLFVEDQNQMCCYPVVDKIRRQYLRYKTAKAIQKEELWNWIEYQGWDLIKSGKEKLQPYFETLITYEHAANS